VEEIADTGNPCLRQFATARLLQAVKLFEIAAGTDAPDRRWLGDNKNSEV
jgi:hypothetical protein